MRHPVRLAAICLLLTSVAGAETGGYVAAIEKWREDFDADIRTGGWLTLVGRCKVDEGTWTLGSDRRAALVLPSKAPAQLGVLSRRGSVFQFEPASGADVSLGGNAITGPVLLSTKHGTDGIKAGDLSLAVRAVGEDFYLLVSDSKNPGIEEFKGTTWYAVSPSYRVAARFVPYVQPQTVRVPLTHADSKETMRSVGDIVFQLAGKSFRLKTFADDEGLFVMFQDDTNGKGTYGGGRFIYAPKPTDGVTALDFNKAFNPYCSLNPYIMCPIPPAQNRLPLKIAAGERFFGE